MSERSGVEIDYCPQCRGVWLDRGELDKIIDRSESFGVPGGAAGASVPVPPAQVPPPLYHPEPRSGDRRPDERRYDDRHREDRRDRPRFDQPKYDQPRYDDRRRPKKKDGWLGELFDF